MIIAGAGLAGLLAGNMLRRFEPRIIESQSSLPNNHAALLRFRSNACSIAFSIPFRKVTVQKSINYKNKFFRKADLHMQNKYSAKVTGTYLPRSIMNTETSERYVAPMDLIAQSARSLDIEYNTSINAEMLEETDNIIISTIPMNIMMDIVGWSDKPEFRYAPIWSVTCTLIDPDVNVYQTIYSPGSNPEFYRASITGNQLILEYKEDPKNICDLRLLASDALQLFGIEALFSDPVVSYQKYGKLLPIDEEIRREFILAMTEEYGVYSLGRFATWRQILLDDVVNDVHAIERMIETGNNYNQIKKWSEHG